MTLRHFDVALRENRVMRRVSDPAGCRALVFEGLGVCEARSISDAAQVSTEAAQVSAVNERAR
jgi:hypothetical protein